MLSFLLVMADQHRAPTAIIQTHGMEVRVYLSETAGVKAQARLNWSLKGKTFHQTLKTKQQWSFINPKEWSVTQWSRPSFGKVRGTTAPILWTLNHVPSGVYEYAAVRFMRLHRDQWEWISIKGTAAEFSGRGTFWIADQTLHICDYELDDRGGHYSPMPFRWSRWKIEADEVKQVSSTLTRRRYSPEGSFGLIPDVLSAANDPMREFGRRWMWWGKRADGGR